MNEHIFLLILAIASPIETAILGVIVWLLKLASADRREQLTQLKRINGTVQQQSSWIEFHERWCKELSMQVRSDISGLEDRERQNGFDESTGGTRRNERRRKPR